MADTEGGGGGSGSSSGGGGATVVMKVTVKTLDSRNHDFTIPEEMAVKDFKEKIEGAVGIPATSQRLIFRGRVLHDDKVMKEYNVANNTIHVVQRPPNANPHRNNDEPQPHPQRGSGGGGGPGDPQGMQGGLIIAAQTGPLPNLGARSSAASRLQASNRMLSSAATLLRRLEEEVEVPVEEVGGEGEDMEVEHEEGDEEVEQIQVNLGEIAAGAGNQGGNGNGRSNFGNFLSQMASAATVASLANAVRGGGGGGGNGNNNNNTVNAGTPSQVASGGPAPGGNQGQIVVDTNQVQGRRPESPRLREMALVLDGILSFNDRLSPYLRALTSILRENRQYDDTEERESIQFLFNAVSTIMHYMSHSYHALSDMICDFSVPAETRRLRAATAILLETSTVVRASIPIAAAVQGLQGGGGNNRGPGQNNQQGQGPQPEGQQQQQALPQSVPLNAPIHIQLPQQNPNAQGQGQGMGQIPMNQIAQAVTQQVQQMLAGGAGGAGMPTQFQFPPGGILGGAHIQVEIAPGGGDDDGGMGMGGGGGQQINIQDLASALGPLGVQMGLMQPPQNAPQGQNQAQTQGQTRPRTPSSRSRDPSPAPGRGGNGNRPQGQANNNVTVHQAGAFDVLLPCNSHHGCRNEQTRRPAGFRRHVVVDKGEGGVAPSSSTSSSNFLVSVFDTLIQSNVLALARPGLRDVIVSYLMRGRDAKNKDHLKSCAKKLARENGLPFLLKFAEKYEKRDKKVNYSETLLVLLSECLTEVFHITVTMAPTADTYQYQSSIITICDAFMKKLMAVYKKCLGSESIGNAFAEYIRENVFASCSLAIQENVMEALTAYFSSLLQSQEVPPIVEVAENVQPTTSASSSSSSSSLLTIAPRTTTSTSSSPEVVPPKQAKQSTQSPVPSPAAGVVVTPASQPSARMDEDDLDTFLNLTSPPQVLNHTPSRPQQPQFPRIPVRGAGGAPGSGGGGPNLQRLEDALHNIPSNWVDTVRHDIRRQLGMPDQPPFSPAYTAIFSRKQ